MATDIITEEHVDEVSTRADHLSHTTCRACSEIRGVVTAACGARLKNKRLLGAGLGDCPLCAEVWKSGNYPHVCTLGDKK